MVNGKLNHQLKMYLSSKDLAENSLKYLPGENKENMIREELFKNFLSPFLQTIKKLRE